MATVRTQVLEEHGRAGCTHPHLGWECPAEAWQHCVVCAACLQCCARMARALQGCSADQQGAAGAQGEMGSQRGALDCQAAAVWLVFKGGERGCNTVNFFKSVTKCGACRVQAADTLLGGRDAACTGVCVGKLIAYAMHDACHTCRSCTATTPSRSRTPVPAWQTPTRPTSCARRCTTSTHSASTGRRRRISRS